MSDTKQVRAKYIEEGFDCIPLKPNSKLPLAKGWQDRPPFRQWQRAPEDANFGLRAGHGKAFIDCDTGHKDSDPATTGNVTRWLDGLGIRDYPTVQTPSGGTHVYVNFAGDLLGSKRNLTSTMGTGEFCYSHGSYVAAPPSAIEEGNYTLTAGDIAHLPTLDLHDIAALINLNETVTEAKPEPRMSSTARALATGQGIERYQSRSEAEAALVLSLVNSGFDFQQIKSIFDTSPCAGKYAEIRARSPKKAEAYLLHTWRNAEDYKHNESLIRRKIRELQELAERAAWSNAGEKLVFLAHTQIAYKAGRFEYAASRRDLALEAGITDVAAMNATKRLMLKEQIKLQERSAGIFAHRYFLPVDKNYHFLTHKVLGSGYFCPSGVVAENGLVLDLDGLETSDAFRNGKGRLGRRAGQVYKLLFTDSLTPSEIAERTGASLKTICRVLAKLAAVKDYKTGEILEMVTCEAGRWHSNVVDLDIIEAIYGTRGAKAKQRMAYERERREHARSLERGKLTA